MKMLIKQILGGKNIRITEPFNMCKFKIKIKIKIFSFTCWNVRKQGSIRA